MSNGIIVRTKETVNIRISVAAWKRLTNLKQSPGDDFDTVVTRLLDNARPAQEKAGSQG